MKTAHKNNQPSHGTKADSNENRNQYQGTKNTDRNQGQDYASKKSPGLDNEQEYSLDDKTAKKPMTGNDKKKSEQPGKHSQSADKVTMADNDDDSTRNQGRREYDDTDHQHDYKTPVSKQSHNADGLHKTEEHHNKNGNRNH